MNSITSKPKAGLGDIENIRTVLGLLKVPKVVRAARNVFQAAAMRASPSTDSLASSHSAPVPMALCDGIADDVDPSVQKASCFIQVETLENKFEALNSLRMEILAEA